MKARTCKILAQLGMSLLVISTTLADDDPKAATHAGTHEIQTRVIVGGGGVGGGGGVVTSGGPGNFTTANFTFTDFNSADRAAIISTQPMDPQAQAQLKEDLSIMQKLVH